MISSVSSGSRHLFQNTVALFAAPGEHFETTTDNDNEMVDTTDSSSEEEEEEVCCGQGFYKQTGPDGDYCVFDYDAAANAFGTDEQQLVDGEEYWEALIRQNRARAKFGMEPLTPEEYVALQAQIHKMDTAADATEQAFSEFDTNQDGAISVKELKVGLEQILGMEVSEGQVRKVMKELDTSGDGMLQLDEFVTKDQLRSEVDAIARDERELGDEARGILHHFMKSMFQDTCESNFDCERPEVCCDFHFKKMCCSSGDMAKDLQLEYATVPVPQQAS